MTKDVIALTPTMPDVPTLLAGLYAGGPDLRVRTAADGAVVQLCTPDGNTLVSIETPILIHTPGEPARLLGTEATAPDTPVWWTEARATTAIPEAGQLASSFAGRLATVLGGTTWPPEAATTDVIPLTTDTTATPANTTPHPAIDVLTETTAVVLQDRPVIPMTSWLSDALRTAITSDRALHIVTPNTARLTLPTRNALGDTPTAGSSKTHTTATTTASPAPYCAGRTAPSPPPAPHPAQRPSHQPSPTPPTPANANSSSPSAPATPQTNNSSSAEPSKPPGTTSPAPHPPDGAPPNPSTCPGPPAN